MSLIALGSRPVAAFSLIGDFEAWQVPAIGYNPRGVDIGAPKNLGEEYRWNLPVITYGFDNSFLNYFGSNGVAAVDAAMNILNSLPNVSSLSDELSEFPLELDGAPTSFRDARRLNLRAQADNLVDLKSVALGLVVEELGLANPVRWTWALRDRKTFTDPDVTNYLVIQRNFDPVTYEPSKYVNGTRFTYQVLEFENPTFADAVETAPVDPEYELYGPSAVAAISGGFLNTGLGAGVFYNYLTRDDIGGLRYLYDTNNVNVEPFPAGTQIFRPDTNNLIFLTNLDLTLLSTRSLTSSLVQISNFYPGIIIDRAFPRATNVIGQVPVVVTQQIRLAFTTNRSIINIVTNQDLATFSRLSLTNPPAALLALFPDLIITSTNTSVTSEVQVASLFLTNAPKFPWGDPFQTNLVLATNFVTNLVIHFHYTFANVITNFFSPVTRVRREVFGIDKEPWSDPLNPVFKTNVTEFLEQRPSGGIIILPPGIAGFEFLPPSPATRATNIILSTNVLFFTNFVSGNILRTISDIEFRFFTNVQFAAFPIEFIPGGILTNIFLTNFVTTPFITFDVSFANVITNYSGPITPIVTTTFEIRTNAVVPGLFDTNIVSIEFGELRFGDRLIPSGGFLIDTNLTGFEFTGFQFSTVIPVTNIVVDFTNPLTGIRTVQEVVYNFTNTVYAVFPFILEPAPASLLRPGIDKLRFEKIGSGRLEGNIFDFTNRFQAAFFTNGVLVTNTFVIIQGLPDILFGAADLGVFDDSVRPIQFTRSENFQNNAALNSVDPDQGGPGTIFPTVNIFFNKIGPSLVNTFPGFTTEASVIGFANFQPFVWGSFDGSTKPPIVYPKDISLEEIEFRITGQSNP